MDIDILRKISKPIFYVTNDVSRGIGLERILPNYHIVCLDDHPLVDILKREGVSVFCLERALGKKNLIERKSGTILSNQLVLSFIKENSGPDKPNILFFKPQRKIEIIAQKNGFNLLGNSVAINRLFEDKVSFFELCQKNGLKTAEGEISNLSFADYETLSKKYGSSFVIQFGYGWAGNSTFFISNKDQLEDLKTQHPNIKIRVQKFIKGRTILNNAVVFNNQILISKPALQIKSDQRLSSNKGATGGRQWPANINESQENEIYKMTSLMGKIMQEQGYKGYFGLDFLIDDESGEIYISEDNARLTASTPFYTKLELDEGNFPLLGYHLLSFFSEFDSEILEEQRPFVQGSEIVVRNNNPYSIVAKRQFKTGVYNQNLQFISDSSSLDNKQSGKAWITAAAIGRIVNPEIEIIRLDTFDNVCDNSGNLNEKFFKLIEKIKEEIAFEKC